MSISRLDAAPSFQAQLHVFGQKNSETKEKFNDLRELAKTIGTDKDVIVVCAGSPKVSFTDSKLCKYSRDFAMTDILYNDVYNSQESRQCTTQNIEEAMDKLDLFKVAKDHLIDLKRRFK